MSEEAAETGASNQSFWGQDLSSGGEVSGFGLNVGSSGKNAYGSDVDRFLGFFKTGGIRKMSLGFFSWLLIFSAALLGWHYYTR